MSDAVLITIIIITFLTLGLILSHRQKMTEIRKRKGEDDE